MNAFKIVWPAFPVIQGVDFNLGRLTDAERIGSLSQELIEGGLWGWSWNPYQVAKRIQNPNAFVLTVWAKGQMVAFAIMKYGKKVANLELLAVIPEYQRSGIGQCLVRYLEHSAFIFGISIVFLEVRVSNTGARSFYQSLGFKDLDFLPRYYSGSETAIRMSHRLRDRSLLSRVDDKII
ncbi:GNAT family N-acetyltransferase [bacterium]|nr:GNAT family N-acetyltransferase [bacterium]